MTINAVVYYTILTKLKQLIQNCRCGLLISSVSLLHTLHCNTLSQPLHSPDLKPSDFHCFPKFKTFLEGKRKINDDEFEKSIVNWLNEHNADFYD